MRMMMTVQFPNDPFNEMVEDGTVSAAIEKVMGAIKPEAAYFTTVGGSRGAILIVDVAKASAIPGLAEPLYLTFDAEVEFQPVMTPEDLAKADLGKFAD